MSERPSDNLAPAGKRRAGDQMRREELEDDEEEGVVRCCVHCEGFPTFPPRSIDRKIWVWGLRAAGMHPMMCIPLLLAALRRDTF